MDFRCRGQVGAVGAGGAGVTDTLAPGPWDLASSSLVFVACSLDDNVFRMMTENHVDADEEHVEFLSVRRSWAVLPVSLPRLLGCGAEGSVTRTHLGSKGEWAQGFCLGVNRCAGPAGCPDMPRIAVPTEG